MNQTVCPNCNYTRQPDDIAPETECPSCGIIYAKYTPKPKSARRPAITQKEVFEFWAKAGMSVVAVLFIGYAIFSVTFTRPEPTRHAPSAARVETKAVYNSPWDGSVRQVERYLKASLKDPGSFSAIEWSPVVEGTGGGFTVRCKFRAKNSLGGFVVENHLFNLDSSGNVIGSTKLE